MAVLHPTKENFNQIESAPGRVLLDFYADWCGPCRMVAPILEEIAAEHPEFTIAKINVDDQPELASRFGVMSIPTLVVLEDGNIVHQSSGARPKAQILALLQN